MNTKQRLADRAEIAKMDDENLARWIESSEKIGEEKEGKYSQRSKDLLVLYREEREFRKESKSTP